MAEYINRKAVLDKLPNDLPYKASVRRVLMQAPTTDVVEVVRCKDCIHYDDVGECEVHPYDGRFNVNYFSAEEKILAKKKKKTMGRLMPPLFLRAGGGYKIC